MMVEEIAEKKIGFAVDETVVYVPYEKLAKILRRFDLKQYGKEFRVYKVKIIDMIGPKATRIVDEKDLDVY